MDNREDQCGVLLSDSLLIDPRLVLSDQAIKGMDHDVVLLDQTTTIDFADFHLNMIKFEMSSSTTWMAMSLSSISLPLILFHP